MQCFTQNSMKNSGFFSTCTDFLIQFICSALSLFLKFSLFDLYTWLEFPWLTGEIAKLMAWASCSFAQALNFHAIDNNII